LEVVFSKYAILSKRKQRTKTTDKPEKLRVTDNQKKVKRTNIPNIKSKQKRSEKLSPKMLKNDGKNDAKN
jgi:hypothetical protein